MLRFHFSAYIEHEETLNGAMSTLVITSTGSDHFGPYNCSVATRFGRDAQAILFEEISKNSFLTRRQKALFASPKLRAPPPPHPHLSLLPFPLFSLCGLSVGFADLRLFVCLYF